MADFGSRGLIMFNLFKNIWEYLFFPWEVEVIDEGHESWTRRYFDGSPDANTSREYVTYKYTHRFRPQVKIVKKYLN